MAALADADLESDAFPKRTIVCVVPDLQEAWRSTLKDAKLSAPKKVPMSEPGDVRITARSNDLIALIEGRLNVGFAFLTGKIRVEASTSDLMMIRRLF